MPIKIKRIVQAIGKTKLGGKKKGLLIVRYQVVVFLPVKKEPIYAVNATKKAETKIAFSLKLVLFIPKDEKTCLYLYLS